MGGGEVWLKPYQEVKSCSDIWGRGTQVHAHITVVKKFDSTLQFLAQKIGSHTNLIFLFEEWSNLDKETCHYLLEGRERLPMNNLSLFYMSLSSGGEGGQQSRAKVIK